jgi:lysyl-tRNA synthetase class 2
MKPNCFETARGMGMMDKTMGKGKLIDEIFGAKCEGNYIQPTFITDYQRDVTTLQTTPVIRAYRTF